MLHLAVCLVISNAKFHYDSKVVLCLVRCSSIFRMSEKRRVATTSVHCISSCVSTKIKASTVSHLKLICESVLNCSVTRNDNSGNVRIT